MSAEVSRQNRYKGLGPTGRTIEVPKTDFQRIKEGCKKFEIVMDGMADQVNQDFLDMGAEPVLRSDGRISMDAFDYEDSKIKADKNRVDKIKIEHFKLDKEESFEYKKHLIDFKSAHEGREPVDIYELLDFCVARSGDTLGNLCEMVTTAVLHRNLGERCLVARSSEIDDLARASDGYIYDRKTSARMCAIDEYVVHDDTKIVFDGTPQKFPRLQEKIDRQTTIMQEGGARLDYGFELSGDEVLLREVENIPIFIAAINSKDIFELAETFSTNINAPISKKEREIFRQLCESLKIQATNAKAQCTNKKLKSNLDAFLELLADYDNYLAP